MKIFKIFYYLFIAAIVAVILLLLASILPIPGGVKVFVVQSGSMEPAIKTGSVVVVKSSSDYKVSDTITFGPYSKIKPPTTHRIAEIKDGNYITKGDANNAPDPRTVAKRDIIGKAVFSVPYLGYAVATAKQPYGFIILILIPAAIIVYDEVRKIIKEIKKIHPVK
jgi:signal peptidase